MRSRRETRWLAAERERKGSRINKLITRLAMKRVALRNDLIGDDYSAAFEMMESAKRVVVLVRETVPPKCFARSLAFVEEAS